jgi:hypothetical protein
MARPRSSPPGYSRLSRATAQLRPSYAWLSLDEDDNDLARFLTYVVAALENGGVTLGPGLRRLLEMAPLPPVATLVTALLNELSQNGDPPLLLVLDDYHRITEPQIHEALQLGLDRAPPGLHLLLLTREDPPLTLSRWRVRNQLVEIRAGDLRFTPAEAAGFLNNTMGLALSAGDIAALEQRTEGWIAGLQLAALALQSRETPDARPDATEFIAAFSGSHHYIIDYLLDEVLRQEAADVRDFLQQTAILDRFTASLCEAVAGWPDAQRLLAYLERRNLFLIPLDSQRRWFRYHHLLADSLQAGLDETRRREANRRAAAWFASHGYHAEAIDHAAAAGDHEEVARLVRLAAEPAFARGEIRQIAAWLRRLPHETIVRDPDFGVFWLLSLILSGHSHEAPAAIAALEEHAAGWQNPRQEARLLVIKAWIADIISSPERIDLAQRAAAATRAGDPLFRAFVAVPLGHAYLYQGQLDEAVRVFREGLALGELQGATFVRVSLLGNLIHALNHAGHAQKPEQVCQQAIAEFVDSHGTPLPPAGLPYLLSAWLHYDANKLEEARQDLSLGRDCCNKPSRRRCSRRWRSSLPSSCISLPARPGWRGLLSAPAWNGRAASSMSLASRPSAASPPNYTCGRASWPRSAAGSQGCPSLPVARLAACGAPWSQSRTWPTSPMPGSCWWRGASRKPPACWRCWPRQHGRRARAQPHHYPAPSGPSRHRCQPSPGRSAAAGGSRALSAARPRRVRLPRPRPCSQRPPPQQRAVAPVFVESVLAALPAGEHATRQPPAAATAALAEPLTEQELVILRLLAAGLLQPRDCRGAGHHYRHGQMARPQHLPEARRRQPRRSRGPHPRMALLDS